MSEEQAQLLKRFGPGTIEPLPPDASTRAFFRLVDRQGERSIVMQDRAGGAAAQQRLLKAHALFAAIDVPVPALLDSDAALAATRFEDFGEVLLADTLASLTAAEQERAYARAGTIAARIATLATPRFRDFPELTTPRLALERLSFEMEFFIEHELRGRRGWQDEGKVAAAREPLLALAAKVATLPREFAHRDFHARNLMLRADGELGLIDFQDALEAPRLYDLASLLRDPYVDPDERLCAAAAAAYRAEAGLLHDPRSEPAFGWAALERDIKAIGTYAYQVTTLGRTRFAAAIPVAERLAKRSLEQLAGEALTAPLLSLVSESSR